MDRMPKGAKVRLKSRPWITGVLALPPTPTHMNRRVVWDGGGESIKSENDLERTDYNGVEIMLRLLDEVQEG